MTESCLINVGSEWPGYDDQVPRPGTEWCPACSGYRAPCGRHNCPLTRGVLISLTREETAWLKAALQMLLSKL